MRRLLVGPWGCSILTPGEDLTREELRQQAAGTLKVILIPVCEWNLTLDQLIAIYGRPRPNAKVQAQGEELGQPASGVEVVAGEAGSSEISPTPSPPSEP